MRRRRKSLGFPASEHERQVAAEAGNALYHAQQVGKLARAGHCDRAEGSLLAAYEALGRLDVHARASGHGASAATTRRVVDEDRRAFQARCRFRSVLR